MSVSVVAFCDIVTRKVWFDPFEVLSGVFILEEVFRRKDAVGWQRFVREKMS